LPAVRYSRQTRKKDEREKMNTKDKNTEATIVIEQSGATARELAEERIRAIDRRVAEIKAERTALNRQKHLLIRRLVEPARRGAAMRRRAAD
jgi:hypothetical protein